MSKYSQAKLIRTALTNEIGVLERLTLETANERYVEKLLSKLLGYGRIQRILNVGSPQAFRVRINPKEDLFENVKELWWPPPQYVRRGRCNDDGQPVFYYSDSEETAIIEKKPNKGELLTVLTSELINPTMINIAASVELHKNFNLSPGARHVGRLTRAMTEGRTQSIGIFTPFSRAVFSASS